MAADTFSSELGILSKSKPRLITSWNLRQVPPGTNGGVTIVGTLAGLLGAFLIALTSALLLPFCSVGLTSRTGRLFGENQPGLDGGSGWGLREKGLWIVAVTLWGGLGSILDSFLGGWLQSSVVDARTGKVIEGIGGKKVGHDCIAEQVRADILFVRCLSYPSMPKKRMAPLVERFYRASDCSTTMASTISWH